MCIINKTVYNNFMPVKKAPHIMPSTLLKGEEISAQDKGTAGRACQKILSSVCCLKFRKLKFLDHVDSL